MFEARRLHELLDGLTLHAIAGHAHWARGTLVAHLRALTTGGRARSLEG